jgi:hypothetical protein
MLDLAKTPPKFQLQPLDLIAPGFRGLNTMQAASLLDPSYATEATNAIIDSNGRLAARDGVTNLTTTPADPAEAIRTIFEYRDGEQNVETIIAWDGGLSNDIADPDNGDIAGSVDVSDGTWLFQNFNNKVIGFQEGQKLIVYDGTTFATVTEASGTAPTGGVGLAAFGRIWQTAADGQTIQYSGLLDETDWHEDEGGGLIDMRTVWTNGTDTVMALAAFNGSLVVFGLNHVVFFVDGKGSALGLDPTNIYVADTISGIGAVSQWTLQHVGETDLLFLSLNGVQSIKRLIAERSAPVASLTKYVRDDVISDLQQSDATLIRSTYNAQHGFYLLSFPEVGTVWVVDQRRRYTDGEGHEVAVVTKWDIALTALYSTIITNILYVGRTAGQVGQYLGDTDEGSTFRFVFLSPWLDLGEEIGNRLKILKRLGAILFVRNQTTVTFKWFVDFSTAFKFSQKTLAGDAAAEYGTAEYGEDEYSGGLALRILKPPARGKGQYFRIGIEADVNGEFALQQAELFAKIGRLA